jgi:hypothetical protein
MLTFTDLISFNEDQLLRLERRANEHFSKVSGTSFYSWDYPTLRICYPTWWMTIKIIRAAIRYVQSDHSEF